MSRDNGGSLGVEQFDGRALYAKSSPEEIAAAKRNVKAMVSPEAWFDDPDTGTWGVVDALFTDPGKARYHGDKPRAEWVQARREWLDRCRAWCAEQGRPRSTSWIPAEEQRAYTDATGDVWTPPARRAA